MQSTAYNWNLKAALMVSVVSIGVSESRCEHVLTYFTLDMMKVLREAKSCLFAHPIRRNIT